MTNWVVAERLYLEGRLNPTSFTLGEGELVALIGPNGSGKTSLLHALAGIGSPRGAIRIGGTTGLSAATDLRRRQIGFMPASRELRWPLIARDLVALGGAKDEELARFVEELGLEEVIDRPLDRLSTGERSRVLLARVLAPAPHLLLLDEPTANLDPLWQIRVMESLRRNLAQGRQSALVALHDLDAACRYADRIFLMGAKSLRMQGKPADVMESPLIAEIFGIEKADGQWRPALRPSADPRSSP